MPNYDFNRRRIEDDGIQSQSMSAMPVNPNAGELAVMQSLEGSAVPTPGNTAETMNGYDLMEKKIGKQQITEAYRTLLEYKQGKSNLEKNIIENQQWYKLRQWEYMRRNTKAGQNQVEPTSAWLFNTIQNKHADAMDNYPTPNIRPREPGDQKEAKNLSDIVPVVLEQAEFEEVYDEHVNNKLIGGTGIYGVFWDPKKLNGLGDIDIEEADITNLFWEPGIKDVQQSRNLFYVTLRDNDLLEEEYPQFKNKLGSKVIDVSQYIYDDTVDTSKKSEVVDWYYKKSVNGRTVLHYCKFIAGQTEAIFATEDEHGDPELGTPDYSTEGWYDHGLYPFIFDPMYPCKGTPCGFSLIDVGKPVQEYIDRGDQAIMQNLLFNARPRHFIRSDGAVNEKEYADVTKDLVHVDGNLGEDSIRSIQSGGLNQIYVTVLLNKIEELKETTGNRDVSTGGTTSGVTAASAIAAMQEAGSKLSRDMNKGSYRAYKQVVLMVIELIRQFYDTARCFRITGTDGADEFVTYSNENIIPQAQSEIGPDGNPVFAGVDVGYRLPIFDVEVNAEKASPYTKMAQNELAFQMYGASFFDPRNAEPALMCLNMMDFDGKDELIQGVSKNAMLYQNMMMAQQRALQLAQMLDNTQGSGLTQRLLEEFQMTGPGLEKGPAPMPPQDIQGDTQATTSSGAGETKLTKQARERVADSTAPR